MTEKLYQNDWISLKGTEKVTKQKWFSFDDWQTILNDWTLDWLPLTELLFSFVIDKLIQITKDLNVFSIGMHK